MNPQGAFAFLLGFAIDFYIFLVFTRFLLQLVRADFYNPISQFVVRATNPVLIPLRRVVPGFGGVDVASLVMVLILVVAKVVILSILLSGGFSANPLALVIYSLREIASLLLNYIFWSVLLRVILSWISPDPYSPVNQLVNQITEPVMGPARKLLPPLGGFDLSPIIVIFAVQFLQILFRL